MIPTSPTTSAASSAATARNAKSVVHVYGVLLLAWFNAVCVTRSVTLVTQGFGTVQEVPLS